MVAVLMEVLPSALKVFLLKTSALKDEKEGRRPCMQASWQISFIAGWSETAALTKPILSVNCLPFFKDAKILFLE